MQNIGLEVYADNLFNMTNFNSIWEELNNVVDKYYVRSAVSAGIQRIVSEDRNLIMNEKLKSLVQHVQNDWAATIEDIKENFNFNILDVAYMPFPAYKVQIEVEDHKLKDGVTKKRYLIATVSLLCNYYTVYFLDRYSITDIDNSPDSLPVNFSVSFSKVVNPYFKEAAELFSTLSKIVEKHFPNYHFLPHGMLMTQIVDGKCELPTVPGDGPHPVFLYLFDADIPKNLEIRE